MSREVTIIGAGIMGITAAAYLAEAGCNVTVLDRDGICEGTSSGNAAAFAYSEILPLAQKGVMRKLPRWLMDPLGPFSIPPRYLLQIAPWLFRFWRASSKQNREASVKAQAELMRLSEAEWRALMDRSGTGEMLRENGSLELYESEAEFEASLPGWIKRDQADISFRHVRGHELADLQPGLSKQFIAGTFVPGWKTVSNPKELALALWNYCSSLGCIFEKQAVSAIGSDGGAPVVRFDDGMELRSHDLVVAAGAWSHHLARHSGDKIPLETERGYNTTLPAHAFDLERQLIFGGHGFVITPLDDGIRIGGAVELGGLELAPNMKRAKSMLTKAAQFLPGLNTQGGREWMGYRPSLPDSLPVIGRSSRSDRIYYAFGHGHLGLTQASATARLIRDMILRQTAAIDIDPFSPQRF